MFTSGGSCASLCFSICVGLFVLVINYSCLHMVAWNCHSLPLFWFVGFGLPWAALLLSLFCFVRLLVSLNVLLLYILPCSFLSASGVHCFALRVSACVGLLLLVFEFPLFAFGDLGLRLFALALGCWTWIAFVCFCFVLVLPCLLLSVLECLSLCLFCIVCLCLPLVAIVFHCVSLFVLVCLCSSLIILVCKW